MRINKQLLIALMLFIGLWLQYHIGAISYLLFFGAALVVFSNSSYLNIIRKNRVILALGFVIATSYIYNLQNYELITHNHAYKTGNYMPMLYLKIAGNGLILFICALFAYAWGYKLVHNRNLLLSFFKSINLLFLINSFVSIITWFLQTGGIIERYNFVSPIDNSPSLSATFAVWGILITLSIRKFSVSTLIFLLFFFINIVIVVTRMNQVVFIISMVYLYFLNTQKSKNKQLKYLFFVVGFLLIILLGGKIISFYFGYYSNMFAEDSYDMLSRQSSILAAWDIFKKSPFLGVGYGMFGPYNMNEFRGSILESPHNGFFAILSELGLVGMGVVIVLFYRMIKVTRPRIIHITEPLQRKIRNMSIVNLRIMIISFPLANFILLPPPSERIYYFSALFTWVLFGIVQAQYDYSFLTNNDNLNQ